MKLDPEIVEAVARALNYEDGEFSWERTTAGTREWYSNLAQVALTAAAPLIEAAVLEKAAKAVEEWTGQILSPTIGDHYALLIRALKEQP